MAGNTVTTTRKGCFQLAKTIGNRYRFDLDEAWFHELVEEREPNRLWYERIPCAKDSHIGVYSVNPLIFKLHSTRPKNAKKIHEVIKGKPGFIKVDFAFDGEAEIYFTKEALPTVAEMAGARRRRRLSEEHKAKLAEVGKAHHFKRKIYGSNGAENEADLKVLP